MKLSFLTPSKSNLIIIILTVLLISLSHNLWTQKAFIVSFDSDSSKDLTYQVFYTTKPEQGFNEPNSVKHNVKAGKTHVKIDIPAREIIRFRLDLGSNPEKLIISNLALKGSQKLKFNNFNKFNFLHIDDKQIAPNQLIINTNHRDPYIVYKDKLSLTAKTLVDWHIFIILITFYFFVSWKLIKYLAKFKIEKNHSRIDIVFLSVFFALLFVPMSRISDAEKSVQENRMLAKKPQLKDVLGVGNNYGANFDKWFNDRFLWRDSFLSLNSYVFDYLRTHGNNRVLIGKDGWLFYKGDNSLRNFQNLDLFKEEELKKAVKYLTDINDWAKANGKKFYYMICPDKNKIYGEYLPYVNQINPNSKSRANQLIKYLQENTDVKVIYPYEALYKAKEKGLLYRKNDTHWSSFGAYVGYKELMSFIVKDIDVDIYKYDKTEDKQILKGDLNNMMKSIDSETSFYTLPVINDKSKCNGNINVRKDTKCINTDKKSKVFVFRDSFTSALAPYFNNTFNEVNYRWRYNIKKEDLTKLKDADIIILEQVERFVKNLKNLSFSKD